jgi:hypothetical protein
MSCLFNSLSHLLGHDSFKIRQEICDYLEANRPIMEGIETRDILNFERSDYVAAMRSPSTWGGAIEIQAACMIWSVRILVQNRRDAIAGAGAGGVSVQDIEFLPVGAAPTHGTCVLYWTGGHYEPVCRVAL